MEALGIPPAGSWAEMQDVPNLLIEDALLLKVAAHEAREWQEAQSKAKQSNTARLMQRGK